MGKRKRSASVRTSSRQRARLDSSQMSLDGESSGNVAAAHNLDEADALIVPEVGLEVVISETTDGSGGDVLVAPETPSAHEGIVMPGQPVGTVDVRKLKDSNFQVLLNASRTKQRTSEHLNFGTLLLHPSQPSEEFCSALREDSPWSTEVWIYVRGAGECSLYAEMKSQSNRKRNKTNCLVENLPGRMCSEALSLLTAISEQPNGKQLVSLMWQRPAATAVTLTTDGDGRQQWTAEGIVATVLVSLHACEDASDMVRTLLGSQKKAILMALSHFFPSVMQRRNRAKGSGGEHYLSHTVKLYGAVAAYNARSCLVGKIEKASVTCRERGMEPILRNYQWRAVRWMLGRENAPGWGDEQSSESDSGDGDGSDRRGVTDQVMSLNYRLYDYSASFQRLEDVNGVCFYVHTASGVLSKTLPNTVNLPFGGVLADEMGLGKTLEVLGCILLHPRPGKAPLGLVSERTEATVDATAADVCGHAAVECSSATLSSSPLNTGTFFECSCWQKDDSCDKKERVQCARCGIIQHAECMAYDTKVHTKPYMCPYCLLEVEPIRSKTTLIVVPESIAYQWQTEIVRHIMPGKLSYTVYNGASTHKYVQPLTLCKYDIVITTYEILCKELRFTNLRHSTDLTERRLGKPKRFTAFPSPLKAIQWWRICLDEAQMVESVTTKTAEMTLMLHAVNRWCVTGTPVQHSLQDLYGLMLFLGVKPFCAKRLWQLMLYEPHLHGLSEELHDVISRVMWRSSKADVADELGLPPIKFKCKYLNFQPVEDFFYRQLSQDCLNNFNKAMRKISNWEVQPNSLAKVAREQVMDPLRQLLRACVHPQAVRHFLMRGMETTLTMEEVAQRLVKKAVKECEELHRTMVSNQLGLAALYILKKEPGRAIRTYRNVLKSARVHLTKEVRTDQLQLLHTAYNLRITLQKWATDAASYGPSTSAAAAASDAVNTDEQQRLLQMEHDIRNRYINNSIDPVNRAREEWRSAKKNVTELTQKLSQNEKWWAPVIETCMKFNCDVELVKDVLNTVHRSTDPFDGLMRTEDRFKDARGMILALEMLLRNLSNAYREVTDQLAMLNGLEPRTPEFGDLLRSAVRCCLRPDGAALKTCHFCVAASLLYDYERKVFCLQERVLYHSVDSADNSTADTGDRPEGATLGSGRWKPSEPEVTLNALICFWHKRCNRIVALDDNVLQASEIHLNLFKAWRAEFKPLRALWVALYERARSLDELEMATERLQLLTLVGNNITGNAKQQKPAPKGVAESQVPAMIVSIVANAPTDDRRLATKMRHLQYLRHFVEDSKNSKLDPCCICLCDLSEDGWTVLLCGHYACYICMLHACDVAALKGRRHTGNTAFLSQTVSCPLCRAATPISQLTTVRPTANSNQGTSEHTIDVKGDLSSKMKAVVRCVKKIFNKDQLAKIIVVSECLQILWRVQDALNHNDINYLFLNHHAGLHQREEFLATFKTGNVNVLLLPIAYGSAGLNLVEATHVIFPSPIINPAQEFQAIGRVHRIGQTRPTFVHYFIMKDTIEQKLHAAVKKLVESSGSNYQFASVDDIPLTLQDIAKMFNPK